MASTIKVDTIENIAGSGNVSLGSGHNLVVPGNSTVGGTLGVTGDTTLTGNLGVGVAPERKFHVEGSGAEFSLVDTSRPTDKKTMNMFIDANGKGNIRMMNDAQNAGNAAIVIEGSSPHTAPIVATPYQPSFCARLNSTPAMDVATVPFETVLHNVGNHYNNSTYRFTAPVTGRYYLSYSVRVNHGTSGHIIHPVFFINGSSDTTSRTIYKNDTSAQYMGATFSYVRQLNANDYVTVNMASGNSGGNMQSGQCSFTGHLLG